MDESDAGSFRPLTTGAGGLQNLIILFVKLTFHYIIDRYISLDLLNVHLLKIIKRDIIDGEED